MLITSGQKRERSASQQPYCSRASVRISSLTEPRKPGRPAVTTPANIPMENAATVLAMAKSGPMIPPVIIIMLGSVTGDETQKAMMGARGTPRRRREAMRGRTPRPHTGVTAPIKLAISIERRVPPLSQESARSDQLPRVSAPASSEAMASTGRILRMPQPTFLSMSALASGTREPVRRRVPVSSQINASALGRRSRSREGLTAEIAIASLFFERIYLLPIYRLSIYIWHLY